MEGDQTTQEQPQEKPLDVAGILASAVPEPPLTGLISNADGSPVGEPQPSQQGPINFNPPPPKQKRQYRKREKEPVIDPLWVAIEQARFGDIHVMCHRLFYKACEAEDLSEQEAVIMSHSTNVIMHHLLKQTAKPGEALPWATFLAASIMPVAARIVPISKATEGFWRGAWNLITEQSTRLFNWVSEKMKPKPKAE